MIRKRKVFCNIFASLAKVTVLLEGIDEILWPLDFKNSFTIKSFSQRLYDGGNCPNFRAHTIWNSKAATTVFFA